MFHDSCFLPTNFYLGTSTINQIERIMNVIPQPSKYDIDSIGSIYAGSVLEKMALRPRTNLESLLPNSNGQALDLVKKLLVFNPDKRLKVEEALKHPYVATFHNPQEEPALNYDVTLSLSDDIQLSISDYRNKLYELIINKKSQIRRIPREPQQNATKIVRSGPSASNLQKYESSQSVDKINGQIANQAPKPPTPNKPTAPMVNGAQAGHNTVPQKPAVQAPLKGTSWAPIAEPECSDTDFETAKSQRSSRRYTIAQNVNGNVLKPYNPQGQNLYKANPMVNLSQSNHKALDSFKPIAQQPPRAHSADSRVPGPHLRPVSSGFTDITLHQKNASKYSWMPPKNIFRSKSKDRKSSGKQRQGSSKSDDFISQQQPQPSGGQHQNRYTNNITNPSLGAPKVMFGSYTQNHGTITASGLQAIRNTLG